MTVTYSTQAVKMAKRTAGGWESRCGELVHENTGTEHSLSRHLGTHQVQHRVGLGVRMGEKHTGGLHISGVIRPAVQCWAKDCIREGTLWSVNDNAIYTTGFPGKSDTQCLLQELCLRGPK